MESALRERAFSEMQKSCELFFDNLPSDLLDSDVELTTRSWADFFMEDAFWVTLTAICSNENIKPEDFICAAKHERPALSAAEAVRTQIARHLQKRAEASFDVRPINRRTISETPDPAGNRLLSRMLT